MTVCPLLHLVFIHSPGQIHLVPDQHHFGSLGFALAHWVPFVNKVVK